MVKELLETPKLQHPQKHFWKYYSFVVLEKAGSKQSLEKSLDHFMLSFLPRRWLGKGD